MPLYLFSALAAVVTVAGFATVVWASRLASRYSARHRRWLGIGLLVSYFLMVLCRPVAWTVIDLGVLAGATGGVLLLEGTLQTAPSVAVFLSVAATVDILSITGGLTRVLLDGMRTGSNHWLLYLALVSPVHQYTIPIVGISDLFVGGSAAVALMRLKLPPAGVMMAMSAGFLSALAVGLWRGATPTLPFLAVSVYFLLWKQARRLRCH